MMNNIYLLRLRDHGYDEYDAWVVVAENEEEAIKLCGCDQEIPNKYHENEYRGNVEYVKFLGKTKEEKGIVLGSFNAG